MQAALKHQSYRAGAGCGFACGAVAGFEKSTFGTCLDPSDAAKYASLGLNPAQPAKTLLGNC